MNQNSFSQHSSLNLEQTTEGKIDSDILNDNLLDNSLNEQEIDIFNYRNNSLVQINIYKNRRKAFGTFITKCRNQLQLTQQDLAMQLNCSISTICFLETGKCKDYRIFFIEKLAGFLNIEPIIIIYMLLMPIPDNYTEEEIISKFQEIILKLNPNQQKPLIVENVEKESVIESYL